MSSLVRVRKSCRLCGSENLELAIPMVPTPVAEKYLKREELGVSLPKIPLDLHRCGGCGHVQLLQVVDPAYLYEDFDYRSAGTRQLVDHFEVCAASLDENFCIAPQSLVVDIGSNDGSLLRCFQRRGHAVLGIDPAKEIARLASSEGIPTLPEFLTPSLAEKIVDEYGKVGAVCAFNVYAHADDLETMTDSIRRLLGPDGLFMFECSYLLDIIEKRLLGTIFHEHLSHHSVTPLVPFLRRFGLELLDISRHSIQGGSIVGVVQHEGGSRSARSSVSSILALESASKLHDIETLRTFSDAITGARETIRNFVEKERAAGKSFFGFGAARSGTTLLAQLQLGDYVQKIVDDNPRKQGLYTATDCIPIESVASMYEAKADYTFILAWIHAEAIIANHRSYLNEGGKFIVCFPKPMIVSADGAVLL